MRSYVNYVNSIKKAPLVVLAVEQRLDKVLKWHYLSPGSEGPRERDAP